GRLHALDAVHLQLTGGDRRLGVGRGDLEAEAAGQVGQSPEEDVGVEPAEVPVAEAEGLCAQLDVLDHDAGRVHLDLEDQLLLSGDGDGQFQLPFADPLLDAGGAAAVPLVDHVHVPRVVE